MAGGVYNLVLGADEINEAVSGAYQALISADGYTGDSKVIGGGYFDFLNSESLAVNGNVDVTGHLIVNDNITGYGSSEFANLIATGNSFLSNVTGSVSFDQISATGISELTSLINGINISGGANIAGGLDVGGGIRNTGDFKNFGQFHINDELFITGDTNITGSLFINGFEITGENNLSITITGNGTGGFNFFTEEFANTTNTHYGSWGTSLISSTGVGADGTTANPAHIDYAMSSKGNGGYVINPQNTANKRGKLVIDFQPERGDPLFENTTGDMSITIGSRNMHHTEEGVIIGNRNRVRHSPSFDADNYNFIGGRANRFLNAQRSNAIGQANGAFFTTDSSIIGQNNIVTGASAINSIVVAGSSNQISGSFSSSFGHRNSSAKAKSTNIGVDSQANRFGEIAFGNGKFAQNGDSQTSLFISRCSTSNAVQTEVFLDNAGERITVATDSAIAFETLIIGKQSSSSNAAGYKISGVIANNGGTTALVGSITKTVLGESVASWDATIEADNTNDALVIKVTGTSSNNIRWVATTHTSEVVF
jgi:hypothetical protein|tara:strand:+ start:78255 stop:79874 length:1620 start_codon:yes stop_codon:yes gene_type:complete